MPAECTQCQTPLPEGAAFCPGCGQGTPTGIRKDTGAAVVPEATDTGEAEFLEKLQDALGDLYEVRELIGRGGFGAVYSVWDSRLKRDVAVKALRHDLFPTPSLVQRFQREAESVAKLRHPNIVPIYSIGDAEDFAYFIMPKIEGETLSTALQDGPPMSLREAHRIFRELAGALVAAHRAGIVHRDLKPENIFLEGPERRALLMDFGIAKSIDTEESKLTGTGMIVGTPHYMSPEQAAGDRHLDHRSDIYSLGVVAYQLFAGRTPFEETTAQKLIVERLTKMPEELASVSPAVPIEISDAVMRCLATEPDARWNSVTNLIAVLDTVELPAEQDTWQTEAVEEPKPLTRRRSIAFGAIALTAVVAYLALYTAHSPPEADLPTITAREASALGQQFLTARGATGIFSDNMRFERRSSTRIFMVSALGLDSARVVGQQEVPLATWHLKLFQRGKEEQWSVRLNGTGRVVGFEHVVPDDEPGAHLGEADARVIADAFLATVGWPVDTLASVGGRTQQQASRTDHHFDWDVVGTGYRWNPDDTLAGVARIRIGVDVEGDQVAGFQTTLDVPNDYTESRDIGFDFTLIIVGVVFGVFAVALATVLGAGRRRLVHWRSVLLLGAVTLVGVLVTTLNDFSSVVHNSYDPTEPWWLFLLEQTLEVLASGALMGVFLVVGLAASYALGREVYPGLLAGYAGLLRGRVRQAMTIDSVGAGYMLGGLGLGASGIVTAALWPLGDGRLDGSGGYFGYIGTTFPLLTVVALAVATAIVAPLGALGALAFAKRYLKSAYAAPAIATLIIVATEIPAIVRGDLTLLGGAATMWILAWGTLRFGLVSTMVAIYVMTLGSEAVLLLRSAQGTLVATGFVGVMLLVVPAALAWWSHRTTAKAALACV